MFKHQHPYKPFIPKHATKLIVGTLPPPRFTIGDLKPADVDFCYGSSDGQLWKILDTIFELGLKYENTKEAIYQRKQFLLDRGIGICDMVESAEREKIDASDLGMQNIVLRDLVGYLKEFPNVDTLLFTGGNSKNGPEYFFRKHLKEYNLKLELVSNEVPRIHQFELCHSEPFDNAQDRLREASMTSNWNDEIPQSQSSFKNDKRIIKTVSLTAPSGAANRAVGSMPLYKQLKQKNPEFNTLDFRIMQYREFF
ncbi:MAG: DNA glycosylase [Xanthomarina sp.]|nr:uracil-DNA glycosylase family protein [Xanthomarina sp.]MAL23680.1 DNA glycosylase [Xanthomarina sp.]MBF60482.1 DNA glycosylase [Xanthomarina sp.]HAB27693.1 DNA glycosylase [Xanthomarina gelatinilytica]HAI19381.1 DNA glycosylase [Xanthomarina gelatinilytica]|tara:strand:+ start:1972 stop:2730 length:759 start_codon:yes stop_codon:yes gene_type:complete